MYRQIGLRAALLGASASGAAGSVGVHDRLPAPLRLLFLLVAGGMTLYLAVTISLLVLAVAFRLRGRQDRASEPPTILWTTKRGAHL